MRLSKNTVALILMSISLILLVVLQSFWLRKEYDDAFSNLRKESNFIFRTTIRTMMDSLIQRNILPADDTSYAHTYNIFAKEELRRSPWGYTRRQLRLTDSMEDRGSIDSRIQLIVRGDVNNDSVRQALRPFAAKIRERGEGKTFIVKLDNDSLDIRDVERNFNIALKEAGIDLPLQMHRVQRKDHEDWRDFQYADASMAGLSTEVIPASPFEAFRAEFSNYNARLLGGILPQILFSVFLTFLTGGSFVVMYRSLRSQQRLMELKNDFISNISHELKTPVATVSVAIEALRNFNAMKDPYTAKEYLDIAQNELNRLTIMTDKILKTSVFEKNGVTFIPEPVDLSQVVDQVVASLRLLLEQKNGSVSILRTGGSHVVDGSLTHLTNVVYNLVDNAIKYCSENPSIKILLEQKDQGVTLAVSDNGIGIPAEYRDKVFDKFFRVPTGDVHNAKGYGLGLSYVASVVKSHGGKITLDSSSAGTTFYIQFPG